MGQEEICIFLKEHPDVWFYSREISESINLSFGSVIQSLKRLREGGEVLFKGSGWRGDEYRYKFNK